jgi:hypothetical protein
MQIGDTLLTKDILGEFIAIVSYVATILIMYPTLWSSPSIQVLAVMIWNRI